MGTTTLIVEQRYHHGTWHTRGYAVEPGKYVCPEQAFAGMRTVRPPLIAPRGAPPHLGGLALRRFELDVDEYEAVDHAGNRYDLGDYGPTGWLTPIEAAMSYTHMGFELDDWLADVVHEHRRAALVQEPTRVRLLFGFCS